MKRAILAAIGAAIGPFIGGLVLRLVFPLSASSAGLPPVVYLGAMVGAALFCLLGFWCGSLVSPTVQGALAHNWRAAFCALGAAVGTVIGFIAVERVAFFAMSLSREASEWTGLASTGFGVMFGVPIGAVALCLTGYWLGPKIGNR
jgi:hypothetical protein